MGSEDCLAFADFESYNVGLRETVILSAKRYEVAGTKCEDLLKGGRHIGHD